MNKAPTNTTLITKERLDQLEQKAEKASVLETQNQSLKRELDWFKRQLFGRKSEKRLVQSQEQASFAELFPAPKSAPASGDDKVDVPAHQRRKKHHPGTPDDSGLRFDENQVPVQQINVPAEQLEGDHADEYEIIRYETTYRLAQRIGSYVVLKYVRPVFKHTPSHTLATVPAPPNVFDKSFADVSFIAGMLIDKFVYHLPLYRQHQRLQASGIELSRTTLTNMVERAAKLLEPIAQAQLKSILQSRVLALDETPSKAGRTKKANAKRGKMRTGYYWPLYGERDEVYFSFSATRGSQHVRQLLSGFKGTLLTDGYAAYEKYVAKVQGVTLAQCWSHSRRYFEKALDDEPCLANQALDLIAALYAHEDVIKQKQLGSEDKQAYRGEHCKRVVDQFFVWCREQIERPDLIACESPLIEALNYVLNREQGLRVFLEDSQVQPDTNHLERTLRVIPMGRKAWLFSWNELGAYYVGVIQTLLSTCKLQGVDPYHYLVDVLQRVDQHPAKQVEQLIPRHWNTLFADKALKSDLDAYECQ